MLDGLPRLTVLLLAVLGPLTGRAFAQQQWPPGGGGLPSLDPEPVGLFKAWVDPVAGVDTGTPQDQVNDSDQPFKTLGLAIETLHARLRTEYPNHQGEFPLEGIVFALPGLYGPHGPDSSGDTFPIEMRDRVHVQGLGAGRAIIRGAGTAPFAHLFWPTHQPAEDTSDKTDVEVLVSLKKVSPWLAPRPPWATGSASDDIVEVFDGFTLQGGDVQVLAHYDRADPQESNVIISNCVFDMRHEWLLDPTDPNSKVPGPYIGIYMLKTMASSFFFPSAPSYVDQKLLITNNTFIMAQWKKTGGVEGWENLARPGAAGILDATDPLCSIVPRDCDQRVRGLGNAAIINNLFRTAPESGSPAPAAMLGIDQGDTRAYPGGPAPLVRSNAFASGRVGGTTEITATNGYFYSLPVVPVMVSPADPAQFLPASWHCQSTIQQSDEACGVPDLTCPADACVPALLPVPRVEIYDGGAQGVDPGFVGEYLSVSVVDSQGAQTIPHYVDWRLLPGHGNDGSPLKDQGFLPPDPLVVMENGTIVPMPERPNLSPFDWDGENYGNPRVVDDAIDIGFDEVHLIVMAGSYGNDSRSHNAPGSLNPTAPTGHPDRYVLLRETAGGVDIVQGNQLKVHGIQESPALRPPGWALPPGVLSTPTVATNLPEDYRTKYISFNNSGTPPPPTPFNEVLTATSGKAYFPLGAATQGHQSQFLFILTGPFPDDEVVLGEHAYFNTQAVLKSDNTQSGAILLRSNLQVEYR